VVKLCKICGKTTYSINIKGIDYEKCEYCGLLAKMDEFILPPEDEYNRYLLHDNDNSADYFNYQEKFYFEIKDFLKDNVLDYGCGNNHMLVNVMEKYGIKSNYFDFYFYNDTNYEKDRYKAIILEEVIEHLKDPVEVLKHLYDLLETGGNIIIRTRFMTDEINPNWWYLRDTTHISFFSVKTFQYLCGIFNMKIIYCNDIDVIILKKE
jgi:hypothetical protein